MTRGNEIVVTLLQTAFPLLVVGTVAALPPALGLALLARRRTDSTMFPRVVLLGALVGAVWVPAVVLAFFLGAVPGPVWALALAGVASGAVAGLVIARAKPAAATQAESE